MTRRRKKSNWNRKGRQERQDKSESKLTNAPAVTGVLTVVRSGNGFVRQKGSAPDIFVKERSLDTALQGDTVSVRMMTRSRRDPHEGPRGRVMKVVERVPHTMAGTLHNAGSYLYVVPLDTAYPRAFRVPSAAGASFDDRVVIKFVSWKNRQELPEAEITDVIGPEADPSFDTIAVVKSFSLPEAFPPDVIRAAESTAKLLKQPGDRLDLRQKRILTIDPERARDFDDAISLERDAQGRRILGVHIADVSHFVTKGSVLDKEAYRRGNSVYLPDMVIPMLPEELSNGVCSLVPNEDRLTFSVFMTVDNSGAVVERSFAKSIIRSGLRLTYPEAMRILEGGGGIDTDMAAMLGEVAILARQFRAARFAKHALNLDVGECDVVLDEKGYMTGVELVINDESHQLIEECMVAANEAVAFELSNKGTPYIARVHEPPVPEKIEDLIEELKGLGYSPGDLSNPAVLAGFLDSIKDDPLGFHVRVSILKSMKRAIYTALEEGHYGLAKDYYAHFTSPIRRYPDLVVHRQLAGLLAGMKRSTYGENRLETISRDCSDTERTAEAAERAVLEIKKLRFLSQQIEDKKPLAYEAVVVGATRYGIFVELPQLQVQGLIHTRSLTRKRSSFDSQKGQLSAGGKLYELGTRLSVVVVNVDFDTKRLDFAPA